MLSHVRLPTADGTYFPTVSAQFTISGTVIMIAYCVQLGETPLHFACKFGFVEMVAVLISHPGTDKQPKNTSGLAPKDVCYQLDVVFI